MMITMRMNADYDVYDVHDAEYDDYDVYDDILDDNYDVYDDCLLYTSPSPRDLSTSRMPSSA